MTVRAKIVVINATIFVLLFVPWFQGRLDGTTALLSAVISAVVLNVVAIRFAREGAYAPAKDAKERRINRLLWLAGAIGIGIFMYDYLKWLFKGK